MQDWEQIIIANWKMQLNVQDSVKQAKQIKKLLDKNSINAATKIVVAPSFLAFSNVAEVFQNTRVVLGAQDSFEEDKGAYTGEVSLKNLQTLGCRFVILGHSERRALGETDEVVNRKAKAVINHGLVPVICVGEPMKERQVHNSEDFVFRQLEKSLADIHIKEKHKVIIAYEPIWAIGSGHAMDPQTSSQMAKFIKQKYNFVSVIYGGSADPDNIHEFTKLEDIEGALVGGASLDAKTFVELIKNS